MVIDYSKWDRMEYDDDDDDDDNDDNNGTPRVTSLDRPGRVSIGPTGSTIELLDDGDHDDAGESNAKSHADAIGTNSDIEIRNNNGDDHQHHHRKRTLLRLTRNGGMHLHTLFVPDHDHDHDNTNSNSNSNSSSIHTDDVHNTRKEGREVTTPIYWSQDRYAVTLRLGIDPTIFAPRNIRIQCKGALPYSDRHSAVGSGGNFGGDGESHGSIEIVCVDYGKRRGDEINKGSVMTKKSSTAVMLLSERLHRPIYLNEGDDELDFEIEDCTSDDYSLQHYKNELDDGGVRKESQHYQRSEHSSTTMAVTKFVSIVLLKAVPMIGMTYWWDRLFVGYPTIDMDTIVRSDRKDEIEKSNIEDGMKSKTRGDGVQKGEGEAFRKAWEEAHASFREKMKTRERQVIDIDE